MIPIVAVLPYIFKIKKALTPCVEPWVFGLVRAVGDISAPLARFRLGICGLTRLHSSLDPVHDLMALMIYFYHDRFFNVNTH